MSLYSGGIIIGRKISSEIWGGREGGGGGQEGVVVLSEGLIIGLLRYVRSLIYHLREVKPSVPWTTNKTRSNKRVTSNDILLLSQFKALKL